MSERNSPPVVAPPREPRAPIDVTAPFRVVDPYSGRVLLEVALEGESPVLRLFNASGEGVVELEAGPGKDGGGQVVVRNARGQRGAYLRADTHGGDVVALEALPEVGDPRTACLFADHDVAAVTLCDGTGAPIELRVGGKR